MDLTQLKTNRYYVICPDAHTRKLVRVYQDLKQISGTKVYIKQTPPSHYLLSFKTSMSYIH